MIEVYIYNFEILKPVVLEKKKKQKTKQGKKIGSLQYKLHQRE